MPPSENATHAMSKDALPFLAFVGTLDPGDVAEDQDGSPVWTPSMGERRYAASRQAVGATSR